MPRNWYLSGWKYCSRCERYIKCEETFCPDCGRQLRQWPRDMWFKQRYRRMVTEKESIR